MRSPRTKALRDTRRTDTSYWQVGAGFGGESGGGRSYHGIFLDFGVMLIGPGEYGEYSENVRRYEQDKYGRRIQRFVEEVKPSDKVALKRPAGCGQWEILAVGVVKSNYICLPVFDDVEGWDIRHGRHVDWRIPADGPKTMGGFTRGTLNKVAKENSKRAIDSIWESGKRVDSRGLPSAVQKLDDEDLCDNLVNQGLPIQEADSFVKAFRKIRDLAQWYRDRVREGVKVKEHETRTFLIVPLLLALGWPEKKLKIEWHNIDIAFFEDDYREATYQCVKILESKKLLESLATKAKNQVTRYSSICPNCETLVVSEMDVLTSCLREKTAILGLNLLT